MYKYILKRLMLVIPVVLCVSFIVFTLMDLAPGDPVYSVVGDNATQEDIEIMREKMGLNDPLLVRYFRYMLGVLQGDLGYSEQLNQEVWDLYITRLPTTLYLAVGALAVNILIGIPFGIIAAVKQNTLIDTGISTVALFGLAIPNFWLGILLILMFALKLGWFPSFGAESSLGIVLPAVALGVRQAALLTRTTRSSMLDVIRQDYLRTTRAKGLPENKVIWRHALKNALIPIITVIGGQLTILFGGAVVIESVFAWPGIGKLVVQAIRGNDFTTVTGCIMMTSILVTLALLAVDILYAFVDPRIKAQYSR